MALPSFSRTYVTHAYVTVHSLRRIDGRTCRFSRIECELRDGFLYEVGDTANKLNAAMETEEGM